MPAATLIATWFEDRGLLDDVEAALDCTVACVLQFGSGPVLSAASGGSLDVLKWLVDDVGCDVHETDYVRLARPHDL
jgi:hypothetical protein